MTNQQRLLLASSLFAWWFIKLLSYTFHYIVILLYLCHVYNKVTCRRHVPVPSPCAANKAIINRASEEQKMTECNQECVHLWTFKLQGSRWNCSSGHFSANVAFVCFKFSPLFGASQPDSFLTFIYLVLHNKDLQNNILTFTQLVNS